MRSRRSGAIGIGANRERNAVRILLVEDDAQLAHALSQALRQSEYAVDWIGDGQRANSVLKTENYDLVVLDLMLPGLDGLHVLQHLRTRGTETPVLIITAHGSVSTCVEGLDLGADDYIEKPFEVAELEARMRALLRRSQGRATGQITFGPIMLDTNARQAVVNGDPIALPRRELCLLEILLIRASKVTSKEVIAAQMFSFDDEAGPNAIEIYVSRLRKKLAGCDVSIRTIRGLGYLIDKP